MYKCMDCGLVFDEPRELKETFETEFGSHTYRSYVCPDCLNTEIAPADLCPICREAKFEDEILCSDCRSELLDKIHAFFDELTYEQEKQFDEWMDGRSITDRSKWA